MLLQFQNTEEYLSLNPMGQVPTLIIDGITFTQSVSSLPLYTGLFLHELSWYFIIIVSDKITTVYAACCHLVPAYNARLIEANVIGHCLLSFSQ